MWVPIDSNWSRCSMHHRPAPPLTVSCIHRRSVRLPLRLASTVRASDAYCVKWYFRDLLPTVTIESTYKLQQHGGSPSKRSWSRNSRRQSHQHAFRLLTPRCGCDRQATRGKLTKLGCTRCQCRILCQQLSILPSDRRDVQLWST